MLAPSISCQRINIATLHDSLQLFWIGPRTVLDNIRGLNLFIGRSQNYIRKVIDAELRNFNNLPFRHVNAMTCQLALSGQFFTDLKKPVIL